MVDDPDRADLIARLYLLGRENENVFQQFGRESAEALQCIARHDDLRAVYLATPSTNTVLRSRLCQLTIDDWKCKRKIDSLDETETYCAIHRTVQARARVRQKHAPVPAPPRPPVVAPVVAVNTLFVDKAYTPVIQRAPELITRDEELPILMDRVVEIESLPPERTRVVLSSEVEHRANPLISWSYAIMGRKRSRRYECFTRPEFSY